MLSSIAGRIGKERAPSAGERNLGKSVKRVLEGVKKVDYAAARDNTVDFIDGHSRVIILSLLLGVVGGWIHISNQSAELQVLQAQALKADADEPASEVESDPFPLSIEPMQAVDDSIPRGITAKVMADAFFSDNRLIIQALAETNGIDSNTVVEILRPFISSGIVEEVASDEGLLLLLHTETAQRIISSSLAEPATQTSTIGSDTVVYDSTLMGAYEYVVQPGETLFGIALAHNVAVQDLAALNDIDLEQRGDDVYAHIEVDQVLRIPSR